MMTAYRFLFRYQGCAPQAFPMHLLETRVRFEFLNRPFQVRLHYVYQLLGVLVSVRLAQPGFAFSGFRQLRILNLSL